jgi:hypothetical protein
MSNLQNIQRKLASGVTSWLNFEFWCNRGDLLSEKSLAQPIGQILSGEFETEARIKAEVIHPYLKRVTKKKGSLPKLDFAIVEPDKNETNKLKQFENGNWIMVSESKWIGETLITFKQVVWDLIRLELIAYHKGCSAYFILSGFHKKMTVAIGQTHFYSGKKTTLITEKKKTKIILDLTKLEQKTKDYINNKLLKYKDVEIPGILCFEHPHFSPDAKSKKINMSFETVVWEVKVDRNIKRTGKI